MHFFNKITLVTILNHIIPQLYQELIKEMEWKSFTILYDTTGSLIQSGIGSLMSNIDGYSVSYYFLKSISDNR